MSLKTLLKLFAGHTALKTVISLCIFFILLSGIIITFELDDKLIPVLWPRPSPRLASHFFSYGHSKCLPDTTPQFVEEAIQKQTVCRQSSPFTKEKVRIGTVTAQFGKVEEHYQKALKTHVQHSLIHGSELHIMCDKVVDDLWNKPAFILDLLMREMLKPEAKRLEWIMWVDRDTLILDQCRPLSSFLSQETPHFRTWRRRNEANKAINLLVTEDGNGLNNGIFLLRVGPWAIDLFSSILAFRYYRPDVELTWTEQSAMQIVMEEEKFKDNFRFVPRHWFNGNDGGEGMANSFADRKTEDGLQEEDVRRGDFIVHFPGNQHKDQAINAWLNMLQGLEDVWESNRVQRDITKEVVKFWNKIDDRV